MYRRYKSIESLSAPSEVIETSGLRASRLELEIAESAVLSNADLTATCLKEWKRLGVRVAVNHAGQNYSSLSYLSRLSINRLKLDKSLIQDLTPAKKSIAIVHALISPGTELGIEVIAEGVETVAQFQLLAELGCQQVQGYLLARPAPAVQAQLALRRSWAAFRNRSAVRVPTSPSSTHLNKKSGRRRNVSPPSRVIRGCQIQCTW